MGLTSSKEAFDSSFLERPPITGQSGLQALQRAEMLDNYRTIVGHSHLNRAARAGQIYLPSPFSNNRTVPPPDPTQPWPSGQVIWMDPTADDGLPHTRPPYYILISREFPEDKLAGTILHERVHVSQRLYPTAWMNLFKKAWDMEPWSGEIPADIQSRRRMNPDILGVPLYAWKGEWVPLALFKSSSAPKLSETDLVWWNAKTRTLFRQPPPGWTEFFGTVPAGEHPFELAAYLIEAGDTKNRAYAALKPGIAELPVYENLSH
jgi:hypothetical protein